MIMASAACILCAYGARGQEIAALQRRMASGRDAVRVTETADAAAAVRAVEQRTKSTKVNGYTIVILFDNTQQARENAVKAKETFEENFKGVNIDVTYENPWFTVSVGRYLTMEEAIIELGRIRSVFPKAFPRSAEMDIADFISGKGGVGGYGVRKIPLDISARGAYAPACGYTPRGARHGRHDIYGHVAVPLHESLP